MILMLEILFQRQKAWQFDQSFVQENSLHLFILIFALSLIDTNVTEKPVFDRMVQFDEKKIEILDPTSKMICIILRNDFENTVYF